MLKRDKLIEVAAPHYERNDPAHDLSHALRVAELARVIASEEGGDLSVIIPAALCHDLGKWQAPSHSVENGKFIAQLLRRTGYDSAQIEKITQAVQRHSFDAPTPPSSLEEEIVFDADKLEGLGAIGVGRCFAVSGSLRQTIFGFSSEKITAQRLLSERLRRCYERLHTPTARRLGQARHDFLVSFIEQLERELSFIGNYA